MNSKVQTANSVVASMASYILLIAFAYASMLQPYHANAQAAAQTTVERIGSTNQYNLVFHQDIDDPISLAGVEYYVVVTGTSPSISLSVPDDTWLFDPCHTTLNVGSPEVTGSTYKFPIYAWREDNEPQDGDGLYLRVTTTTGIIIAVDDFPTKALLPSTCDSPAPGSLQEVWRQASTATIYSLDGMQLATLKAPNLTEQAAELWPFLQQGAYLLDATMADGRRIRLKVVR